MAVLFDTSSVVLLLRKRPIEDAAGLVRTAHAEILSGSALLPAVAASELLIGECRPGGVRRLSDALADIPTVILSEEAAALAGAMGAFLAGRDSPVPLPDLLIAATAAWLDIRLLAWDRDYARSIAVARACRSRHPGAAAWRSLQMHSASIPVE